MRMTIGLGLALAVCLPTGASALEMKAGVAKAPITNNQARVMVNSRLSLGTLKDIYARVLVLNDGRNRLVFVTYDLNCLDVATPLLRKRVENELGIDKSHLILLATHNPAKATRMQGLLDGLPLHFRFAKDIASQPVIAEDGSSHLEIAQAKAVAWSAAATGLAIASDGGLVVPALGESWSSIFTRRSTGEKLSDEARAEQLLALMQPYHGSQREVSWVEALAIARDGTLLGSWEAQGLHGLLAEAYKPPPKTTAGFWLPGLWCSGTGAKRYWELTDEELAEVGDPWAQLRPAVRQAVEDLLRSQH